jgi:hypothetical protein
MEMSPAGSFPVCLGVALSKFLDSQGLNLGAGEDCVESLLPTNRDTSWTLMAELVQHVIS